MLNSSELKSLLGAMRASRVTTLEVKNKGQHLRLVLSASVVPSTPVTPFTPQLAISPDVMNVCVSSLTIGTFLRRGIDDGLPLLEVGMRVTTGEVLGYVCHGPVRVIVDAPADGVISNEGPDDGAVLGLGDVVFELEVAP
ncbi:MAG: hypothetical protein AB8B64_10150 [Granulosicoccus sp.]